MVQVLLSVDLIFTSIVFLYPFNEALERELLGTAKKKAGLSDPLLQSPEYAGIQDGGRSDERSSTDWTSSYEWKRNFLRTGTVCCVGLVAYLVPSFSLLTGLTGGFGNNILGFILPTAFYWKLQNQNGYWRNRSWYRYAEQAILFGIFLFGLGFLFLSTSSFVSAIAGK
jgi:hypothetical protein